MFPRKWRETIWRGGEESGPRDARGHVFQRAFPLIELLAPPYCPLRQVQTLPGEDQGSHPWEWGSAFWPLTSVKLSLLSVSSSADSALWWETCGQRFPPSNSQGGLTLPGTEFPLSGLDERQDPPVVHWVKELPSGLFLFSETIVDKPKLHADSTPTAYPSQVIY